jgi:tRNA nucleotidyltransferase (CCA-adding enzyme)
LSDGIKNSARGISPAILDSISQNHGKIYLVGGPVRDELMGRAPTKDLDFIVCGIEIEKLEGLLKRHGDVNLVGQAFGVIKFKPFESDEVIDLSLPRKERSTGTGHRDFKIDFDPRLPIEKDLERRDFTINAMARELPEGGLIDPFSGRVDLENKILRMVSDLSFPEDPLRILRGVQFAARFDLAVEEKTLISMAKNAGLIKSVSPERIAEEINKLLEKADMPSTGFNLMRKTGLLELILPELVQTIGIDQPGGYHRWDVFEHTLHVVDEAPPALVIRLAALFHDVGKPQTRQLVADGATFYGHDKLGCTMAETALRRLKYSNEVIGKVSLLIDKHMFSEKAGDKGIRRLINKIGTELIFDLIALRKADTIAQGMGQTTESISEFELKVKDELSKSRAFGLKDLALNGNDLKRYFDLKEGPVIGQVLNFLMDKVLDEPELNTAEQLRDLAGEFLAKSDLDI